MRKILPKSAEISRVGETGAWALYLDGVEFPWHIEREDAEVINLTPGATDPFSALRIGIIIGGPVVGAEEFNEFLADELDSHRVRKADHRDLLAQT